MQIRRGGGIWHVMRVTVGMEARRPELETPHRLAMSIDLHLVQLVKIAN